MIRSIKRLALSVGIALSLSLAFMPLGCGSSSNAWTPVLPERKDPAVPEHVVRELTECAKDAPARLSSGHTEPLTYHVQFNVYFTNGDSVDVVEVGGSTLEGGRIEACMASALRGLTLPTKDIAFEQYDPTPKGSPSPESRTMMGSPAVAALAPVSLAPVVVAGLAIIVVVAVVIYVASDSSGLSKQDCINLYVECTGKPFRVRCDDCLHYCRAQGAWPDWRCPR